MLNNFDGFPLHKKCHEDLEEAARIASPYKDAVTQLLQHTVSEGAQPEVIGRGLVDKVYFVTLTSARDLSVPEWNTRIKRITHSKTYPVIAFYGCFERTKRGRLHVHIALKMRLRRSPKSHLVLYPSKKYIKECNMGEMIDKKTINTVQDLGNVYNYIDKEDLEKIGTKFDY